LLSRDVTAFAAFIVLVILSVTALFGSTLSAHDPNEHRLEDRLLPPAWAAGGSPEHLLGTDALGRDVGSRLIHGTRLSLFIPFASVLIAGSLGTILGLIAGFYAGKADAIIMRLVDSMMALSSLLLVLVVTVMIGVGVKTLIMVFGLTAWVLFTRVVRGMSIALREAPFVSAARCAGCSDLRVLLAHIMPSSIPVIFSVAVVDIARLMISEAGLSFLGFGVQPPSLSWGLMLAEGRQYLTVAAWLVAFPGLSISISVLAITVFGTWVRGATDPFHRQISAAPGKAGALS
jgi:peptide/nickel transport system permease protein